jgi:hypothetical protein
VEPKKRKATLEYSKGSNVGRAIYLATYDENGEHQGGYRIAGGKCWGYITVEKSFELDVDWLDDLIREAKAARKYLAGKKRQRT